MARPTLALVIAGLLAVDLSAAATARSLYAGALAREQAVRTTLAAERVDAATLKDVRALVAAYAAIVRQYPASGYSDNALWQAGRLSLDAFARFGQPQDRTTGIRLLRTLASQYPTSKLVQQVEPQLAGVEATAGQAEPPGRTEHAPPLQRPNRAADAVGAEPVRPAVATIRDVRRAALSDAVRVTIELDSEVPFHEERLADPARVFLDLPSTRAAAPLLDRTLRFESDNDIVRQIRIGRHPNTTTRVVLDAAGVSSYSVYALYNPYRLVIDCVRAGAATPGAASAPPTPAATSRVAPAASPLRSRRLVTDWGRRLPSVKPTATPLLAAASAAAEEAPKVAASTRLEPPPAHQDASSPAAPAAPPAKNVAGGFSIARQLGLGVSRIVIDAGHGGHDPGAKGKGVTEAELVLDVALRLEALLQKTPGVEVILTRRTDEFIPLQERTAIANRENADLFLSIHANANPSAQARGIETYFLNFATNLSTASVAARENAASGQAMGALPDFVKAIALNNKLDESRDLATHVQRAMVDKLRGANKTIKDLGVKQAPFVVLIGAAMPSVLAEISFVTNAQEARLLRGSQYRQRIAEALAAAIRKYQTSLNGLRTVAHHP